jgi:hypothetical protein
MVRCRIVLAVALVIAVGCSKKNEPGGGGGASGDGRVEGDPNATYTLKIRPVQEGDQTNVIRSDSSTTETKRGAKTERSKFEKRFEYLERIVEMPAGAALPTKLTRTYHVARRTDLKSGELQPLPFNGKTVDIEKKGSSYQLTIDGKRMPREDAVELESEFRSADKLKIDALLPDHPVRVGESWTLASAILKAFGEDMSAGMDLTKSRLTAQLARAYTQDGHQWGTIAFDFELVPKAVTGTMKVAGTFDTVIDGTAPDGIMKGTVKGDITGKDRRGEFKTIIDGAVEKTVRTAK